MSIFNKNKLKIKKETADGITKINIDYYKIGEPEMLKASLLKELMGENLCLAIIDSKLQYKDLINSIDDLIISLESSNILYRKKLVKEDETVKVLGISMKVSGSTKAKRHILGMVISRGNIDKLEELIRAYNTYYYFAPNNFQSDELLDKVETYFEDEEEVFNSFGLSAFDSTAFNNMNINLDSKYYNYVDEILKKVPIH